MQENEGFSAIVRADLRDRVDEQDNKLRPTMLSDFLGQESVKKNLSTFIEAAKLREEPLDHLLLIGPGSWKNHSGPDHCPRTWS